MLTAKKILLEHNLSVLGRKMSSFGRRNCEKEMKSYISRKKGMPRFYRKNRRGYLTWENAMYETYVNQWGFFGTPAVLSKKKNIEMFYIIWLKLYNFFVIVFKRRFGEKGFGFQSHFDNKTFLSYRNYNHQINCIFFKYPWHKPLTSFIFFETFLALSKNIHGAIFYHGAKSSIL